MSLGSVVFFEHQVVATPFEKNFHKVRVLASLSTIRIRLLSSLSEPPIEWDQEKPALVPRGRKSASITLFVFFHQFFAACLGR